MARPGGKEGSVGFVHPPPLSLITTISKEEVMSYGVNTG